MINRLILESRSGDPARSLESHLDLNSPWPLNSRSLRENSNRYQAHSIRLLARFVK